MSSTLRWRASSWLPPCPTPTTSSRSGRQCARSTSREPPARVPRSEPGRAPISPPAGVPSCSHSGASGPTLCFALCGLAGRVTFDANGDRALATANFRILNTRVDRSTSLLTNTEVAKVNDAGFSTAGLPPFYWPDGTSTTPIDQTTIPEPESVDHTGLLIAMGTVTGIFVLLVLIAVLTFVVRRIILYRRLQRRREQDLETQCNAAINMTRGFSYPAVFVRASDFLKLGALTMHEDLRERGLLVTRDALDKLKTEENLLFFSHQV